MNAAAPILALRLPAVLVHVRALRAGRGRLRGLLAACLTFWTFAAAAPAIAIDATTLAFRQAVAEAARGDAAIATFYRERNYAPIFTGDDVEDAARRTALHAALSRAGLHGLPTRRYPAAALRASFAAVGGAGDRGRAEVAAARMFLAYARDIQSGVLAPGSVPAGIVRDLPRRDPQDLLAAFAGPDPAATLRALAPRSQEYARLMAARLRLAEERASGGWGPAVRANRLDAGDEGAGVVALRDRMIAMGYMAPTARATYDAALIRAVRAFQRDHGLEADGIAGPSTIAEVNVGLDARLSRVLVAMERERWLNLPGGLGDRHVLVNLTDFHARVIDDGVVTFETKAIVGADHSGKETPEFSDVMEYMELNPTWTVPRGILGRDYLPRLQRNRGAASYLQVVDARGRVVPRGAVNFAAYTARSFPYNLVQPPGPRNALGSVKFMFPNPHAIYLHDTPDQHLFANTRRTFSSGCIRLDDPHEFAYHLLERQTARPVDAFQSVLQTGRRTRIALEDPVPVHLIYRTAFTRATGRLQFREDIYGRDAALWRALERAGVSLDPREG